MQEPGTCYPYEGDAVKDAWFMSQGFRSEVEEVPTD